MRWCSASAVISAVCTIDQRTVTSKLGVLPVPSVYCSSHAVAYHNATSTIMLRYAGVVERSIIV
jgi:hypothetical protein